MFLFYLFLFFVYSNHYCYSNLSKNHMSSSTQSQTQFMIVKEVFIDHLQANIIDHYQLQPISIGQGGFGQVFQATKKHNTSKLLHKNQQNHPPSLKQKNQNTNYSANNTQLRAIKKIALKNPYDKELIKNQMEILSYLDHPSIIKLYETFEYKKEFYLVTDLLKGGDLLRKINEMGPFGEKDARTIFIQLIKAINYLHSQNICHRDLKLQNILLCNQRQLNIKLIDFGLAFCWDSDMKKELFIQKSSKIMTGTPDYMSPEMLKQNYDERCDVWAAGVILYMLLSGTTPFVGDTENQIQMNIKRINYTFEKPEFQNVSTNVKQLISSILKQEDERISLLQIFNHSWINQDNLQTSPSQKASELYLKQSTEIRRNHLSKKPTIPTKQTLDKKRKESALTDSQSEIDSNRKSLDIQDDSSKVSFARLNVQKIKQFIKMPMLLQLLSIYSVSKLSDLSYNSYVQEFSKIDKENNGTISIKNLKQYLMENENFQEEEMSQYFTALNLSRRGFISYTQYLACVLSYQALKKTASHLNLSSLDIKSSQHNFENNSTKDIFDEQAVQGLFCFLDRNTDGFICKLDFYELFESNYNLTEECNILEQNGTFLQKIQKLFELKGNKIAETKEEWPQDPRKFKKYLSRTYKGEKDGGRQVSYETFKQIIREQSEYSCKGFL